MIANIRSHRGGAPWLLALLVGVASASPAAALEARLASASGEVDVGRGAAPAWQPARVGEALAPGDALRTGPDGRAELQWQGATIRLYGDSLLRLPGAAGGVELDTGVGLFDVSPRSGAPFEVHTPEVVVSVKGTRFAVSLAGAAPEVSVYRGVVGVRARTLALEREVLVREGFRAVGDARRPAELFLLEAPDPWPSFGPRAAPPEPSAGAPPAQRALDEARKAGRQAIRAQVLKLALERDPGLVERLERAHARYRQRSGVADAMPDARSADADPTGDRRLARLDRLLRAGFVTSWLHDGLPPGSASGSSAAGAGLDVQLSSNGQLVEIVDPATSQIWQFDVDALQDVAAGDQALPPSLATKLQSAGIGEAQLAAMLAGLL